MNTFERINEILEKIRISWDKLGLRTGIASKRIQILKDRREPFTTDELTSICNFLGPTFTLDYLIRGTDHSGQIARYIKNDLKPSQEQFIEEFLLKCEEIIDEANLSKFKDMLMPTYIQNRSEWIRDNRSGEYNAFRGGCFLSLRYYHIQNIYRPYIDIEKVLKLNNYEIYNKLKNYPRTEGQMRHLLKKNNNEFGLKMLKPIDGEFGKEMDTPPLSSEDIYSLNEVNQVEFFQEIIGTKDWYPGSALYKISESNPNYWNIVKLFLVHGAYLTKEGEKDVIKTMMLKRLAGLI